MRGRNLNKLLILVLILSNVVYADTSTFLNQGDKAPYDGFLLDREKATKIRLLDIDYQEALKTKDYLTQDNTVYVKRLENLSQENDKLAKQVVEIRDTSIWSKIGFFVLGAIVTTGLTFGVSKAIH